jgi:hypothetical protein
MNRKNLSIKRITKLIFDINVSERIRAGKLSLDFVVRSSLCAGSISGQGKNQVVHILFLETI